MVPAILGKADVDQIITNRPKFIMIPRAAKKRYTMKQEPERELMIWRMVRKSFPEKVMYELRPKE